MEAEEKSQKLENTVDELTQVCMWVCMWVYECGSRPKITALKM